MKKLLLVYPPFCTPASPPYSLVNLHSFLQANGISCVEILDLNAYFHARTFPEYGSFFKDSKQWERYDEISAEYSKQSALVYARNNKSILLGQQPDCFSDLFSAIMDRKPDIVAFSVVYSSQVFYTRSLLLALKDCITIVGGPSVNHTLIDSADHFFNNEIELLDFLKKAPTPHDHLNTGYSLDYSCLDTGAYFVPHLVLPLKTSSTCYHKKCTFCSHYAKIPYLEYPLETIEKTVKNSGHQHFFLIDDMIPAIRLLKMAKVLKPLNVQWGCQLRPTKEFTHEVMSELHDAGLRFVIWGVESGCDRLLQLMKKGTIISDISRVLEGSHEAGIINVTYIMFGFPSETKEEFLQTIHFLKTHAEFIDLISPSVFGLQRGTPAFESPEFFGITKILEQSRTLLDAKISYELAFGLSHQEAREMKQKHKKTLESINKYPKHMNFFREHMFFGKAKINQRKAQSTGHLATTFI